MMKTLMAGAASAALALAAGSAQAQLAFPGAVGAGKAVAGGRGGAVHLVTTLADSGPGSLRACVEAAGPRTCIFRVSGTIALQTPFFIKNGSITIPGQSSPGGIQVRLAAQPTDGRTPFNFQDTSQIIVRHLHIRPGFDPNNASFKRASNNALGFERSDDWIVDHVTTGYTADQSMHCFQGAQRWTVSNSMFVRALSFQSHHFGPLLCGDQHRDQVGPGTYVGNLTHKMLRRSPNIKSTGCDFGAIDVVNNLNVAPGEHGISIWDDHAGADGWGTCSNIVGNVGRRVVGFTKSSAALVTDGNLEPGIENRWYAADNLAQNGLRLYGSHETTSPVPSPGPTSTSPVGGGLSVTPAPASQTEAAVMAKAGAFPRDSLDETVLQEVRTNNATKPPTSSVGLPYPAYSGPAAAADADEDGMPSNFELAHGLNPNDPADRNSTGPGGYTWLEIWLDERHREVMGL